MTTETTKDGERAAFEAWMRDREGYPYARHYANLMWKAWQARAASQAVVKGDEPRLDKPAQVGNGCFGVGVKWSTVIGAAQRHHAYRNDPSMPRPFPDRYTIREIDGMKLFGVDQSGRRFVDYSEYAALQRELESVRAAAPQAPAPYNWRDTGPLETEGES